MTKLSAQLRDPMNIAAQQLRDEAADLLDECERVMTGVAYYSPEAASMMEKTLAKLRGDAQ